MYEQKEETTLNYLLQCLPQSLLIAERKSFMESASAIRHSILSTHLRSKWKSCTPG